MHLQIAFGCFFFFVSIVNSSWSWELSQFRWVKSDNGEVLCATSPPNKTINAVQSTAKCVSLCNRVSCPSHCLSVNYWKNAQLCQHFYYTPCSYNVQQDCANYQRDINPDPRSCTRGTPGICHVNATCSPVTPYVCSSTRAVNYRCECNQGYIGDGIDCTDIDECATNNGGCSAVATCTNTPGSSKCMCLPGYSGDGFTCTGLIHMYGNNGRAVQISSSNEVVLSADVRDATTFQMVGCLARDSVSESQRPNCVSLMDLNQTDWYVHHDTGSYLRVDPKYDAVDLPQFQLSSSFILHSDTFYPGHYALESVNSPYWYIKSHADGRLGIVQRDSVADYYNTASFRVYDYNASIATPNCSFPFTYNGGLYNGCIHNITDVSTSHQPFACINVNATPVVCHSPGFVATKLSINITIPTQSDPVPVMSVFSWSIIHQHLGYTFDWDLPWAHYKAGFGSIDTDFWLGLEKVHLLTSSQPYRLRVEVQERSTNLWYSAEYWSFKIGDELNTKYRLDVSGYSGDAGDSLHYEGDRNGNGLFGWYYNDGMKFSTNDRDNDLNSVNCASVRGGGWWYNRCYWACLTCDEAHYAWAQLTTYAVNSRMMIKPH